MTTYDSIRSQINIGDVIAFGGRGVVSAAIKLLTRSPVSHVGTVLRVDPTDRVELIESTTLAERKGVQVSFLSERIATYPGEIWWLSLSPTFRSCIEWPRFTRFLLDYEQREVMYDYRQCLHMAFAPLAHIPGLGWLRNHEDLRRVFCSELIAAAFEYSGGLPFGCNSSDISPSDLCRLNIYTQCVQLQGTSRMISGFNSHPL